MQSTQKFKGKSLKLNKLVKNILSFYQLATLAENNEGMIWYNEANTYARELALRFNISVSQVVGIIAAFSPKAGWLENKRYVVTFLLHPNSVLRSKVTIDKAKVILTLNNESAIYEALSIANKAYKTKAFFNNMLNPDIHTNVTIDRHAIAACIQKTDNVFSLDENITANLTSAQYKFFETAYTEAAKQSNILPQQMQAIIWTVYRRLRDLKAHETTAEFEAFPLSDIKSFKPVDIESF